MTVRKIYRARKNRMLGGVCGGIANYFEIDPSLVRFLAIFFWIFSGLIPLLIVYLIALALIPLEPKGMQYDHSFRVLTRSRTNRKIAGICGGLSQMLYMDVTLIRLSLVFLCLITGIVPILIAYLVGWATIPDEQNFDSEKIASRSRNKY